MNRSAADFYLFGQFAYGLSAISLNSTSKLFHVLLSRCGNWPSTSRSVRRCAQLLVTVDDVVDRSSRHIEKFYNAGCRLS